MLYSRPQTACRMLDALHGLTSCRHVLFLPVLPAPQEEPFASRIALQCSNQSGVFKWLEKWITHHAAGTSTAALPQAGANGQTAASGGTGSAGGEEGVVVYVTSGSVADDAVGLSAAQRRGSSLALWWHT